MYSYTYLWPEKYKGMASRTRSGEISAVSSSAASSKCVLGSCVAFISSSKVLCFSQMLWRTQRVLITFGTSDMSTSKCLARHHHLPFRRPKAHSTVILALLALIEVMLGIKSGCQCLHSLTLTSYIGGRSPSVIIGTGLPWISCVSWKIKKGGLE